MRARTALLRTDWTSLRNDVGSAVLGLSLMEGKANTGAELGASGHIFGHLHGVPKDGEMVTY
jgi:hypothetical protein